VKNYNKIIFYFYVTGPPVGENMKDVRRGCLSLLYHGRVRVESGRQNYGRVEAVLHTMTETLSEPLMMVVMIIMQIYTN
jgi:hypothetical protein